MKTLLYFKYLCWLLFLTLSSLSFVTSISIQKYPGVIRMKLKRNSEVIICHKFNFCVFQYITILIEYHHKNLFEN